VGPKHRGNPDVQVFNSVVKGGDSILQIFSFGFERNKPSLEGFFTGKIHAIKLLQGRIDLIKNRLRGRLVSVQAMLNGLLRATCQTAQMRTIGILVDLMMAVPRSQELLDHRPHGFRFIRQAIFNPCAIDCTVRPNQ
jgi:hypothetical protein